MRGQVARVIGAAVMAIGMVIGVAPSASAANASCGDAVLDTLGGRTYVVHSCRVSGSGSVTLQYHVDCLLGSNAKFTESWSSPGGSYIFPYSCTLDSGITVTYKVV